MKPFIHLVSPLRLFGLAMLLALSSACTPTRPDPLHHDVASEQKPWSNNAIDRDPDKYSFAVFSDLTGGERDGIFEVAVEQLNLLRPDLILNVGDLIEGSDDRPEVDRQWDFFDQRAGAARAPVFYVGGNHDLTGPLMQDIWDERYGARYYHLRYRNTLFLILDTEDNTPRRTLEIQQLRNAAIKVADSEGWDAFAQTEYANIPENRGGNISSAQAEYFKTVIAENTDVNWTFLLMHKAPWERAAPSPFHDIEAALGDRPYTVFHGHQHAYKHQQRLGRDYIQLATTGGVQLTDKGRSMDHLMLVTVDQSGASIATLLMAGILDKHGDIPLDGADRCFEFCGD